MLKYILNITNINRKMKIYKHTNKDIDNFYKVHRI